VQLLLQGWQDERQEPGLVAAGVVGLQVQRMHPPLPQVELLPAVQLQAGRQVQLQADLLEVSVSH